MSTAYFIVLDNEDAGFDAFVDGKLLTKYLDAVNQIAAGLGLKHFEDYANQDLSEFGGPEMLPAWFEPSEGVTWVESILDKLREEPLATDDNAAVIEDLKDYLRVFREANTHGLKWHLEIDF